MLKKSLILYLLFTLCLGLLHPSLSLSQGADAFIILNLHWDSKTISLNTIHNAQGAFKKNRSSHNSNQFIYRVFSDRNKMLEEGFLDVPRLLHFDYFDHEKGQLQGGEFLKDEADFVIKIPAHKQAHRMLFYHVKKSRTAGMQTETAVGQEDSGDVIGEIALK